MQDRDILPEAEGRTNGAGDGVRPNEALLEAPWAATANWDRASTPHPWITATAPRWAATMAAGEERAAPVLALPILRWNPSRCLRSTRTPLPASSLSLKTFSSSPRFRRPDAR